jgi:hypothetical protein
MFGRANESGYHAEKEDEEGNPEKDVCGIPT